jgi:hypothetical protein
MQANNNACWARPGSLFPIRLEIANGRNFRAGYSDPSAATAGACQKLPQETFTTKVTKGTKLTEWLGRLRHSLKRLPQAHLHLRRLGALGGE